mgnify:CR=1 FL=1
MKLTFTCITCNKRKFFTNSNNGLCPECHIINQNRSKQKQPEKEELKRKKEKIRKKTEERKHNIKLANEKLKTELEQERIKEIIKEQKTKEDKKRKLKKINYKAKIKKLKKEQNKRIKLEDQEEIINLEKEAEKSSSSNETVLFVSATVKRLKAIGWRNGKKKILLNKEREIRKTHKGGWSQEKFQSFVKTQKGKALDWIESNLRKEGVLRLPYQKVLIQAKENNIKDMLEKILKEK